MGAVTREEALDILADAKERLGKVDTKEDTLAILSETGKKVGYKPVFRALVVGVPLENSVRY